MNRKDLFQKYVAELCAHGSPYSPEDELFKNAFQDFSQKPYYEWVPIVCDNQEVGFLIIGTAPDCRECADYYLAELYVAPKYRHRGLATKTLEDFWKTHKGKYTLQVR